MIKLRLDGMLLHESARQAKPQASAQQVDSKNNNKRSMKRFWVMMKELYPNRLPN
jgi:hypothetical protein